MIFTSRLKMDAKCANQQWKWIRTSASMFPLPPGNLTSHFLQLPPLPTIVFNLKMACATTVIRTFCCDLINCACTFEARVPLLVRNLFWCPLGKYLMDCGQSLSVRWMKCRWFTVMLVNDCTFRQGIVCFSTGNLTYTCYSTTSVSPWRHRHASPGVTR